MQKNVIKLMRKPFKDDISQFKTILDNTNINGYSEFHLEK